MVHFIYFVFAIDVFMVLASYGINQLILLRMQAHTMHG